MTEEILCLLVDRKQSKRDRKGTETR
jgi:hypothetical protein